MMMSSSFQQARLAEQLRLSTKQRQFAQSEDIAVSQTKEEENTMASAQDRITFSTPEEARELLELEKQDSLDDYNAPMMTYQKYLTMQVCCIYCIMFCYFNISILCPCNGYYFTYLYNLTFHNIDINYVQEKRVKVTIRYSAESGLRPFYLTVANQIKTIHPDVLLEKRILPPNTGDGEDAVFEVLIDGKVVIGKKKTRKLMVSSRSDGSGGDNDGKGDDSKSEEKKSSDTPDIAGGRSIFVSMELIDHQLSKARKRRRPNTMYKDALRGAIPSSSTSENVGALGGNGADGSSQDMYNLPPSAMTEAVMRLEKLKALSTRSSSIQRDNF